MFYHLRNLSSQDLHKDVLPWDFKPSTPIPPEVYTNKKARTNWINLPTTEHHVYTAFEGVNPNLRISKLRNDGSGNPPLYGWALIADYDSAQPEDVVMKLAKELPYPPNYIEKTLSGNWRFVWLLAAPLVFPSYDFAKYFFRNFANFAFDVSRGMIGFDQPAWEAPERLWTNSGDWRKVHDKPIDADIVRGWMVKASEKYSFTASEFGLAIPLDALKPELEKRYPKFAQWPGEFVLNAQGPSFFIEGSTSPMSAIVRETGMQTFSAHAAKGFYGWKDLLGAAFVSEYESKALGSAVEAIHFDGRHYWQPVANGSFAPFDRHDLVLHLKVERNLSPKPDKDGKSQIERALTHIQKFQRITGAAPFIFRPSGIIRRAHQTFLNTSTVRVMSPADVPAVWGSRGNFPWLSYYLETIFDEYQLAILLAWMAWAYQGFYRLEPQQGHVLFIAGPVGMGKTLLNREIIGKIFGGYAEAGAYLLGEDNFNAELFQVGHHVVDDAGATSNLHTQRKWQSALKRAAANTTFRSNEKYRTATLADWIGRTGVTLNVDEESARLFPDLSTSIIDKLILLRTRGEDCKPEFPERYKLEKMMDQERHHLCRWLLDHKIPEDLQGNSRFGVIHYAEPSLLETANQSSHTAGFHEILEDWKNDYFVANPKAKYFEGTAYQLRKQLVLDPTAVDAVRAFDVNAIGRHLATLKSKGVKLEAFSRGDLRYWRIYPNEKQQQKKAA